MTIEFKLIGITGQFFQHHFANTYALIRAFNLGDNLIFIFDFMELQNATLNLE